MTRSQTRFIALLWTAIVAWLTLVLGASVPVFAQSQRCIPGLPCFALPETSNHRIDNPIGSVKETLAYLAVSINIELERLSSLCPLYVNPQENKLVVSFHYSQLRDLVGTKEIDEVIARRQLSPDSHPPELDRKILREMKQLRADTPPEKCYMMEDHYLSEVIMLIESLHVIKAEFGQK